MARPFALIACALAVSFWLSRATADASSSLGDDRVPNYEGYDFEAYLAQYMKTYDDAELLKRRTIFDASMQTVRAHNKEYEAGLHSWYVAINDLADWTPAEFAQIRASKQHNDVPRSTVQLSTLQSNPEVVDWRVRGAVTDVKNQLNCGSCWTFAATEVVESHYQIASGRLLTLSPQTYVNCVENPLQCGGTGGCGGGTPELAFNFTVARGIALESDLPYKGEAAPCKPFIPAVKASGYVKLPVNDAAALETALATKGPVAINIAADGWKLYGGGIFNGCTKLYATSGSVDVDHVVQLVGYAKDYWIVRNSWGPGWGEQGYIRLSRASDGDTFKDFHPSSGVACKPFPRSQTVGGECGILFDTSYPFGVVAVEGELVV